MRCVILGWVTKVTGKRMLLAALLVAQFRPKWLDKIPCDGDAYVAMCDRKLEALCVSSHPRNFGQIHYIRSMTSEKLRALTQLYFEIRKCVTEQITIELICISNYFHIIPGRH